jgi:hypothetical protein
MGLEAEMRASRVVCRVESARLRSHDFELDALELLGFRNTPLLYDMSSESVPQFGILPAADVIPPALVRGRLSRSLWCVAAVIEVRSVRFALSFGRDYVIGRQAASVAVARHWPSRQVVRLVLQIRLWPRVSAGRGPRHVLAVESSGAHTPRVGFASTHARFSFLLALMARSPTS